MSPAVMGRTIAGIAPQTNPLPPAAILPQSRLELVPAGAGGLIAKSRRGTLPTPPELHAGNVARAFDRDGAAVTAEIERKLAPMLRAARADLAAAKAVRS